MTEQEKKAIYEEITNSIVILAKAAKAAGFTGEQTWNNTRAALVKLFGIPEEVAAFLIRTAWEKAAE